MPQVSGQRTVHWQVWTKAGMGRLGDVRWYAHFGLAAAEFRLTDFAVVKTFRLIEGQAGHWSTQGWTALDTNKTFDQVRPE